MSVPSTINITTVDAFTSTPFKGNPAAVVLTSEALDEALMKCIAREMNLSETAFAHPLDSAYDMQKEQRWSLRWLTPTTEVDLCGHATLATAHVIYAHKHNVVDRLEFLTRSGSLFVEKCGEKQYAMQFPAYNVLSVDNFTTWSSDGTVPQYVREIANTVAGAIRIESLHIAPAARKLLVVIDSSASEEQMLSLKPDIKTMQLLHADGTFIRGVCVTKKCDIERERCHFISRYWAPWVGINEDPATGSLHCALMPHWSSVYGNNELRARQLYPTRGAEFSLSLIDDGKRVQLVGGAVTVLEGTMHLQ